MLLLIQTRTAVIYRDVVVVAAVDVRRRAGRRKTFLMDCEKEKDRIHRAMILPFI